MLIFSSRKRTANGGLASSSSSSDNNDGDDQNTARQPHLNDFYQDAAFNPRKSHDRLNLGLLSLSHTERNKVLEEVHGVRCLAPPESPEMIHDALCRLEKELAKIPPSHKRAYNLAVRRPTTYVTSDDFRLRFLRCELFDTAKAAQRLVNFVELITDKLPFVTPSDTGLYEKPMSLSNLQEREIELYKKGHIQVRMDRCWTRYNYLLNLLPSPQQHDIEGCIPSSSSVALIQHVSFFFLYNCTLVYY